MYRIEYRADVEGDWTDHPTEGRDLRFASPEEAMAWWDDHYRGPDEYGNQAYPSVEQADEGGRPMRALCVTIDDRVTRPRRVWYPLGPDGRAGVPPWYEDGPSHWLTPGERPDDRVIDSEDIASVRAEVARHGWCHLRSYLIASGLAVVTASRKFDHGNDLTSCVDIQYDHPGELACGVWRSYSCPALGLAWDRETSH